MTHRELVGRSLTSSARGSSQADEDATPISALQHYAYCPRQCALIHTEKAWAGNVFTDRGDRLHDHVDDPGFCLDGSVRLERALPLWSEHLNLTGRGDLIEFDALGLPRPVEYKAGHQPHPAKGAPKMGKPEQLSPSSVLEFAERADNVQLCAQALCLEEMFGLSVPGGAIYHAASHLRRDVAFDTQLREFTVAVVVATRKMLAARTLPAPVSDSRCPNCSLKDTCQPGQLTLRDPFQPEELSS